jgi:hypothetical protein
MSDTKVNPDSFLPGNVQPLAQSAPERAYADKYGRNWRYWPFTDADQMWREVTCNQFNCAHPVVFVGLVDIYGDGVHYYDSASAWCYWCMPRDLMTEQEQHMARHAECARRQTVDDCIRVLDDLWLDARETETVDFFVARLTTELRHLKKTREEEQSCSMLPPDYHVGRVHTPDIRYIVRPGTDVESLCTEKINDSEIIGAISAP